MSDCNALAQRIVAQGVGVIIDGMYVTPAPSDSLDAMDFCNDGRVVLALMNKYAHGVTYCKINNEWIAVPKKGGPWFRNKSLAIAIGEACCEALEQSS